MEAGGAGIAGQPTAMKKKKSGEKKKVVEENLLKAYKRWFWLTFRAVGTFVCLSDKSAKFRNRLTKKWKNKEEEKHTSESV
jgi:hypothetical protein